MKENKKTLSLTVAKTLALAKKTWLFFIKTLAHAQSTLIIDEKGKSSCKILANEETRKT